MFLCSFFLSIFYNSFTVSDKKSSKYKLANSSACSVIKLTPNLLRPDCYGLKFKLEWIIGFSKNTETKDVLVADNNDVLVDEGCKIGVCDLDFTIYPALNAGRFNVVGFGYFIGTLSSSSWSILAVYYLAIFDFYIYFVAC